MVFVHAVPSVGLAPAALCTDRRDVCRLVEPLNEIAEKKRYAQFDGERSPAV